MKKQDIETGNWLEIDGKMYMAMINHQVFLKNDDFISMLNYDEDLKPLNSKTKPISKIYRNKFAMQTLKFNKYVMELIYNVD